MVSTMISKIGAGKSGQIKIQQMAFMLMAVTLFFVLVGMFVLVVKFSGIKKTAAELEEENAMLLVSRLANSPEFSCGFSFDQTKLACVDADKVMMLKEQTEKYSGFWGVSNIEIRTIYPKTGVDKECTNSNYPDCNIIKIREGTAGFSASNFVSLCRKASDEGKLYDKCELAKIIVSYEAK